MLRYTYGNRSLPPTTNRTYDYTKTNSKRPALEMEDVLNIGECTVTGGLFRSAMDVCTYA